MNRVAQIAVLMAATAAPVGMAQTVTIQFEGSLLSLVDPLSVFSIDAEIPIKGQFTYDPATINIFPALPPGVELPIDIGLYDLISLSASVGDLQSFEAIEPLGVLLNDTTEFAITVVDGIPDDPNEPVDQIVFGSAVSFPEEQVGIFTGQMQLQLQGEADWLGSSAQLPPTETLGLENTTAARFVVRVSVDPDFVLPGGGDPTVPPIGDLITSEAVFTITSLSVNGSFIQTFQGEVDLSVFGDLTGDNSINSDDLAALLANFGTTSSATLQQGDLNADGRIDSDDLAVMLGNFGMAL